VSGINRWALYSYTFPQIFYCLLKDPGPLNHKKTYFSGLTTQYAPRLNQGPSAVKKHDSGWVIAWIFLDSGSDLFRSRPIFMRFFFQFSWIFYSKINIVIITVKTGTLHVSPRTIHRFNALLVSSMAEHLDGFLLL
jgi:hypothetical protein